MVGCPKGSKSRQQAQTAEFTAMLTAAKEQSESRQRRQDREFTQVPQALLSCPRLFSCCVGVGEGGLAAAGARAEGGDLLDDRTGRLREARTNNHCSWSAEYSPTHSRTTNSGATGRAAGGETAVPLQQAERRGVELVQWAASTHWRRLG